MDILCKLLSNAVMANKPEIAEAEAIGMLEVLKWLHTSY
ncbi:hypothetical protein A2U01_0106641, partial [Trifolium medium]|nr:hypothetical protein [Trifolium medium]